ncbi:hypothetical protein X805_04760 [Sphaerotilus natans subsp. natans DSM 6575]|uniref:Uncharacterized protein n=1 Tax=Sphaerotilus natans subsp. natans DSM 6575 TaxID=1286631 RepID=A0A059KR09_9BURK|nr:hypothetical protein [Sphaerotilus natans]KDB53922.1 hypothetical protein X805_04760 [Sphaerotilus natans subsp. natans DSM 6575]SIR68296.1 hypothetical protein SAMN05421778_11482 [Sphaerotilus natans]
MSITCKLPTRLPAKVIGNTPLCNCDGQPHFGLNLEVQGEVLRLLLTQEDLVMLMTEVRRYESQGAAR